MAQRKRGRPLDGWLAIDKPAGVTSAAAVAAARKALDARKAGHAGTLDPLATGVLAVAFGEATKTVPFVAEGAKTYRFTVRWGAATTTDDSEGETVATAPDRPDAAAIDAALPRFRGAIAQTPPQVSAVKVDGARAYARARAGEASDLAARPLHVARLDLIERIDADHAAFEMVCGKGGYVRAIARDLGAALGCLGHVAALRRLATGPFRAEGATPLAAVEAWRGDPDAAAPLLPVEAALADLPRVGADAAGAARLRHGATAPVAAPAGLAYGAAIWAALDGAVVATGTYRAGEMRPDRVFAPH